jgi:pyruvate kinase
LQHPDNQAPSISPVETARKLHTTLSDLRNELARDADQILSDWRPSITREEFLPSAKNLADYLAFRKNDLREVQEDLAALGLSSLGRNEAHVRASLDAVIASLAAIAGISEQAYPSPMTFSDGQTRISAQKELLFGTNPDGRSTNIMVTLPTEAGEDPSFIHSLVAKGADCMRINCAHDSKEVWTEMIAYIRAAEAEFGRDVRVEMDVVGKKVRINQISTNEKVRLKRHDQFFLTTTLDDWNASLPAVTVSHPQLIERLTPGATIWIDDGKLEARVTMKGEHSVLLEVINASKKGLRLKPARGINCPNIDLGLQPLSSEDLRNLDFMVHHADTIGCSFVETPEDVRILIDEMSSRSMGKQLPGIVLKIETERAVHNLPRIIVQAGGRLPIAVMIARGDLAVEIGLERLSEIQEEMLWLCEAAHVPVVWATQVLEGLLKSGRATRAETTDAAMGQRAECVMLNKGKYLTDALGFLSHVLLRMERHQTKKTARLSPLMSWQDSQKL